MNIEIENYNFEMVEPTIEKEEIAMCKMPGDIDNVVSYGIIMNRKILFECITKLTKDGNIVDKTKEWKVIKPTIVNKLKNAFDKETALTKELKKKS